MSAVRAYIVNLLGRMIRGDITKYYTIATRLPWGYSNMVLCVDESILQRFMRWILQATHRPGCLVFYLFQIEKSIALYHSALYVSTPFTNTRHGYGNCAVVVCCNLLAKASRRVSTL